MVALIPSMTSLWWLAVVFALAGLGIACLWPSLQSYAADCIHHDHTMLFILLSCGGIPGFALASWAMGIAKKYADFDIGFYGVSAALGCLVFVLLFTRGMRKGTP